MKTLILLLFHSYYQTNDHVEYLHILKTNPCVQFSSIDSSDSLKYCILIDSNCIYFNNLP